jgi:hypothetical protein
MSVHTVLQITGFGNTQSNTSMKNNNTKQTQTMAPQNMIDNRISPKSLFEPEDNYFLNSSDTNNETFSFQGMYTWL